MIKNWISNELSAEPTGVYKLKGHDSFSYSDGADSERYLNDVLDNCTDLSSGSIEILSWIKDWRSEYHLSNKRANLLNGFSYDRASAVLEVGCGCGAISRFLGESFDFVLSIEGSYERASIARKRCRDLKSVHIVSAPFQDIVLKKKFDVIFCIGVLEYSARFVDDADPYNSIIRYFSEHLTEDGILVVAIENRLGLKYFNSACEDHSGRPFDGIEDYPNNSAQAKTFGYAELQGMLSAEFRSIDFYFPFPDYKIPDAIFSEQLLGATDISGLLSKFDSRDYSRPYRPLFSEKLAWRSIAKNRLIRDFANSFLVIASKSSNSRMTLDGLGVITNTDRVPAYHTRSKIYEDESTRRLRLSKHRISDESQEGLLKLISYDEPWSEGETLQTIITQYASMADSTMEAIFSPAKKWYERILEIEKSSQADDRSATPKGLPSFFDAIWHNTVLDNDEIIFVDQEWEYQGNLLPKQILLRSIYAFLTSTRRTKYLAKSLRHRSGLTLLRSIGAVFGESFSQEDLRWLVETESSVHAMVSGRRRIYHKLRIRFVLLSSHFVARRVLVVQGYFEYVQFAYRLMPRVWSKTVSLIGRLTSKS